MQYLLERYWEGIGGCWGVRGGIWDKGGIRRGYGGVGHSYDSKFRTKPGTYIEDVSKQLQPRTQCPKNRVPGGRPNPPQDLKNRDLAPQGSSAEPPGLPRSAKWCSRVPKGA